MLNSFFTVRQLRNGTGQGLFDCSKSAFKYMGVTDWKTKRIGFVCDGNNANIGQHGGLRGHLKEAVPWVLFFGVWLNTLSCP